MQDKRLLRMLHRHIDIEICIYNWVGFDERRNKCT